MNPASHIFPMSPLTTAREQREDGATSGSAPGRTRTAGPGQGAPRILGQVRPFCRAPRRPLPRTGAPDTATLCGR